MPRGTHGEKVVAARESDKLPVDECRMQNWLTALDRGMKENN